MTDYETAMKETHRCMIKKFEEIIHQMMEATGKSKNEVIQDILNFTYIGVPWEVKE